MDVFILDPATGQPLGTVDNFTSLRWKVRYVDDGSFEMVLPASSASIGLTQKGYLVYIEGAAYRIDLIESEGQDQDTFKVSGNSIFPERICLPPPAATHDEQNNVPAETAIKHFLDANAGASAAANRQVGNLVIEADAARGSLVTFRARYHELAKVTKDIARLAMLGWKIELDGSDFYFSCYEGADRSADIIFDLEFDVLTGQKFLSSTLGRKNYAYVAGGGEGAARAIEEVYAGAAEPSGINRRELFVDARDLTDATALAQRGDAKLAETEVEDSFTASVNRFGSFRYNQDWFLGDIVKLRNTTWGINRQSRIVGVVSKIASEGSGIDRDVELDRPYPNLKERVEEMAQQPSGSDLL